MRDTPDGGTEPQGKWRESVTWVMSNNPPKNKPKQTKKNHPKTQKTQSIILFVFSSFWKLTFQGPIFISSFHYEKIEKGQNTMSHFS